MSHDDVFFGFIGAGNMARALISGLISDKIVASKIYVSAPSMANLDKLQNLGCKVTHSNVDIFEASKMIILCVKPNKLDEVAREVPSGIATRVLVSVVSGVKIQRLEHLFPSFRIIRAMPNLPVQVKAGVIAYSPGSLTHEEKILSAFKEIFSSLGLCEEVPEELLDAVCGLSGSGPAFVFTVIQALSDGAVKMGIPRTLATRIASQTVIGAGKMVLETGKHPWALRDEVCSPGGTTIRGLHALENKAVGSAFIDAVEAATNRAKELGKCGKASPNT